MPGPPPVTPGLRSNPATGKNGPVDRRAVSLMWNVRCVGQCVARCGHLSTDAGCIGDTLCPPPQREIQKYKPSTPSVRPDKNPTPHTSSTSEGSGQPADRRAHTSSIDDGAPASMSRWKSDVESPRRDASSD
eukprot:352367-Chlamydomonas_euryale.AAC.5